MSRPAPPVPKRVMGSPAPLPNRAPPVPPTRRGPGPGALPGSSSGMPPLHPSILAAAGLGGGAAPVAPASAPSTSAPPAGDEAPPSYFAVQQQRSVQPAVRPPAGAPMRLPNSQPPTPQPRPPLRTSSSAPTMPLASFGAAQVSTSSSTSSLAVGGMLVPTYSAVVDPDYLRVSQFRDHLQQLLHTGAYSTEFDEIEMATANVNLTADFTSALMPCNIRKSRYKNILPLEHTRVVLHEVPGVEGSDFVCANYVSGEVGGSEHAYIGTQGPLQVTVGDFWRLVWETNSHVIVMLAREVEDGKEKVYPYWPEQVPFEVEYLRITTLSTEFGEEIVTRKFELEEIATGTKRTVTQLQYIAWPDQGIPDSTHGFCQMVDLTDDCNREAMGKTQGGTNEGAPPIIIHCSAGIGRTGTFAVFHATLAKLKLLLTQSFDATFDVKATLLAIREQRAGMVQTVEQYQFCYQVIIDKLSEVMELLQYKNELWFHKGLESKKAQSMLKRKPHGTFLFRDSSAGGCIVLSAVNGKNVLHARISVDHRGFQIENDFYPSLAKLVNSRSKVFMHPILRTNY